MTWHKGGTTPDHTRADQSNGKCRHCQAPAYQSLPVVSELSSKSSDLGFSSKRRNIPGISLNCFSPAKGMRSLSGSGPDSSSNTKCTFTREKRAESKERALGVNATQCSHADFPRADRKIAPEYRSLSQIPPTFAGVVPFNLHSASQDCTHTPTNPGYSRGRAWSGKDFKSAHCLLAEADTA